MKDQNEYSTSDLALAAYLIDKGHTLSGTRGTYPKKITFCFLDGPKRHDDVLAFLNRLASVEPRAFIDNIKTLKSITNMRSNENEKNQTRAITRSKAAT